MVKHPLQDSVRQTDTSRRAFLGLLGVGAMLSGTTVLTACGSDGPARSGSLTWILGQEVPTLDVAKSAGAPMPLLALSHETLIRLGDDLEIVAGLASSWTEVDRTTLRYEIRDKAAFWDGSPVTSADVAFSINRHLDPKVASPIASLLANFRSVEAVGERTVEISLRRPDPTAQYLPALCHVTPEEYSVRAGDQLGVSGSKVMTMGSGPYVITGFESASGIEYEANQSYDVATPTFDSIRIDFVSDANARQLAIRGGSAQGTMDVPVTAINNWEKLPGVTIQSSPPLMSVFLALNVNRAPFDDVHVRRALAHAVDRSGFTKALIHGRGEAAHALPTPAQWSNLASESEVSKLYESLPKYDFDLAKARAELSRSAHPDGFEVTVSFPDANPHLGRALVSLKEAVKDLGIDIDVQEQPMTEWRAQLMSHDRAMNVMLLRPNYPDPTDYLNLLLPSAAAEPGQYNIAEYRNQQVDDLLAKQAGVVGEERVTLLGRLLEQIGTDVPYVPLWWESTSMAVSKEYEYADYTSLYYYQEWAGNLRSAS